MPPTSWRFYDTIYAERFMRTPQENPDGYANGAPLNKVKDLKGELLIMFLLALWAYKKLRKDMPDVL